MTPSSTAPLAEAGEQPRPATAPAATPTEHGNGGMSTSSLDALADSVARLRSQAGTAMHELAQGAGSFTQDGVLALRRGANRAGAASTGYVRAHPLQSVLMAVGVGALLATLLRALVRER